MAAEKTRVDHADGMTEIPKLRAEQAEALMCAVIKMEVKFMQENPLAQHATAQDGIPDRAYKNRRETAMKKFKSPAKKQSNPMDIFAGNIVIVPRLKQLLFGGGKSRKLCHQSRSLWIMIHEPIHMLRLKAIFSGRKPTQTRCGQKLERY
jgi:hypothetical protein